MLLFLAHNAYNEMFTEPNATKDPKKLLSNLGVNHFSIANAPLSVSVKSHSGYFWKNVCKRFLGSYLGRSLG